MSIGCTHLPIARRGGFTLTEMLIVLVVTVILLAVALPSYQAQIRKSRRSDAMNALTAIQLAEEKWRASNTTYTGTLSDLGLGTNTNDQYYTVALNVPALTATTTYTATATAVAGKSQNLDTGCTSMTLAVAAGTITQGPSLACWNR